MTNILKRLLNVLFFFLLVSGLHAQNNFFNDVKEATFKQTIQQRVIIPSKYRTLRLDSAGLLSFFKLLPSEEKITNRNLAPVISIPMPDGTTASFRIWESSAMAPELAAVYADIKTFTGQGIDDPTATIKLDWTMYGFHAMILSPISGAVFIDPYDMQTVTNYITYYKKDYLKRESFTELGPIKMKETSKPANVLAGICVGSTLRTYRLAIACTNQYAIAATGLASPSKAQVLAKIVTSVNRVNGVYEKELSIRLVLVANDTNVIYVSPGTDPFKGNDDANILIAESQQKIDAVIGDANYDIGHTFSTGGGGLAGLGVVCVSGQKASGITGSAKPFGDPYDIDYVAHEIGHQFGANHPFNSQQGACGGNGVQGVNAEPGSGSTIMAYAGICAPENLQNNSDPQFHTINFDEIVSYSNNSSGNACAVKTSTGNTAPVVNAGAAYTIPVSTPFLLTGNATDINGDALTYCWEQVDVGGPFGVWNAPSGDAPLFRSFPPTTSSSRFFPKLSTQTANTSVIGEILPSYSRTMHFRLTARDNKAGGGGVCYAETTVSSVAASGPFVVTSPNASGIVWYVNDFQTVTWDPAGTSLAPINCANVSIQLSTDGGLTFPVTILANTPNDGAEEIQVPNNISNNVRIRVMAVGNIFYDFSDNNLSIQTSPTATFSFNNPATVAVCFSSNLVATLKTASLAGFSTNIVLTASLIPAGTTVSFGTSPIAPGNSTTVTLNNTNSLTPGSYTIKVTGVAGAVTKTRDLLFIVGAGPIVPSSLSITTKAASATCTGTPDGKITITAAGGALPYLYTSDPLAISGYQANPELLLGVGNYKLTVQDAKGCIASVNDTVLLNDTMRLELGNDTPFCEGIEITLQPQTNNGTSVFQWTPAAGLSNTVIKNPMASPAETTKYYLTARWGICQRNDSITLNILPKPAVNAGRDTAVCFNTEVFLNGSVGNVSGPVSFLWAPADVIENSTAIVTTARPAGASGVFSYTLTVNEQYGCNYSVVDTVIITVQPKLTAFAGNDTIAVSGNSVPHLLQATGGGPGGSYVWSWTPLTGVSISDRFVANPTVFLQNHQYEFDVKVTDFAGCTGYDTVKITVFDGPAYYLPNAFSPNGDGRNDIFRPMPAGIGSTEYFRIFNRYGILMFETNRLMAGWDGSFMGKPQPTGTYVWAIKGKDRKGRVIETKGTVVLIR